MIKTQIAKLYIHNLIQWMKPDNLNFQEVPGRTISLKQGSINFGVKGQIVNTSGFVGHQMCLATPSANMVQKQLQTIFKWVNVALKWE